MIRTVVRSDEAPEIDVRIDEIRFEFPGYVLYIPASEINVLKERVNKLIVSGIKYPKSPGVPRQ